MDLFGHMIGTWTSREHGSPPHPAHFKQHFCLTAFSHFISLRCFKEILHKKFYRLNHISWILTGCERLTLIVGPPPRLTSFWIISSQISSQVLHFLPGRLAAWNNKCHPVVWYNLFWSEGHKNHVNWNIFVSKFVGRGFYGLQLGPQGTPRRTAPWGLWRSPSKPLATNFDNKCSSKRRF